MTQPTTCANCGAMLNRKWLNHELRAYECRACGHLTGPEGQALGAAPKRTARSSGILFVVVAVIVVLAILLVQQFS